MKLVCDREELSRGLQSVLRSVGVRAGIPALSGVLFELTDTELSLTTTDLELTTRVRLGLTGEAGKVLVPARLLAEIVRGLPSDDVEFVTENGTVRVAGGRARYEIRSLPPEDFPRVDTVSDTRTLTLDGDLLARALNQVVPAASRDETRPVLTGVLVEGEGDELRIAATDSYRLAVRTLGAQGVDGTRVLVPSRAVAEVARLAPGKQVRVELSSSQIGFHIEDALVQSRLIEGEFPAYRQLLPENLPNSLRITKGPFVEAIKRVAIMAQDSTPIFVELSSERIRISCHAQGLGEAAEDVDGAYTGEEMRVALNAGYLETGIAAADGDEVLIELSDPQRPALIHAPDDRQFLYLLMPIRPS
jgi:DNA polymerase-3 subunit beta